MISFGFITCQNSSEEVTPLDDLRSFTANSDLGMNLTRVTLLDGSVDNYFDNASCLKLSIPFTALVNHVVMVIESDDDLLVAKLAYEQNPYASNFQLVFPVTVRTSTYAEMTVDSEESLRQLATQCLENGLDDDIECIDFSYPLSISTYNSLSQQIGNEEIATDQEFYEFLQRADENELLGFDFPIDLIDVNGSTFSANDNNELNTAMAQGSVDCEENDNVYFGNELELQTLSLKLTDAPFPFSLVKEANVTLGRIDLYTGEGNDSIEFITLSSSEQSFNLLDLTNGLTADLAETDVPVGLYNEIRMEVTQSSIELEDGTLFDLKVPSGTIRLRGEQAIEVTGTSSIELLADFDVSRSFVVQGNPNTPAGIKGFLLKPVIKLSDLSKTGTLTGSITQSANGMSLEGVQVSVYAADTLNTTSFSDQDGQYTILGLDPGIYNITAEKDRFTSMTIEGISLIQSTETVQDIVLVEE